MTGKDEVRKYIGAATEVTVRKAEDALISYVDHSSWPAFQAFESSVPFLSEDIHIKIKWVWKDMEPEGQPSSKADQGLSGSNTASLGIQDLLSGPGYEDSLSQQEGTGQSLRPTHADTHNDEDTWGPSPFSK